MAHQQEDDLCYPAVSNDGTRIIYEQPDVHFRPLPFYDQLCELIRPAGLISDGVPNRANESQVEFKLTIEQANMLSSRLGTRHIILRFCYLVPHQEQDDKFPVDVSITVNSSPVQLPVAIQNPNQPNVPAKRPGQHVDITDKVKISPYISNVINIKWFVDPQALMRSYALTVYIADYVNASTLLERIKQRGYSEPELTKRLFVDSDNEVATTNLQSSLICPLGKIRMQMPCKSTKCQHIPCFDAMVYLQMNEKKASWTCPVCYKPAYFADLMVDGFFMDIIKGVESSISEVKLNSDGSWTPVMKVEQPTNSTKESMVECITISDDDSD